MYMHLTRYFGAITALFGEEVSDDYGVIRCRKPLTQRDFSAWRKAQEHVRQDYLTTPFQTLLLHLKQHLGSLACDFPEVHVWV